MPDGHYPEEAGLLARLKAGDPRAQTRFFDENAPRLYPICVKFLGYGDPDAEDVVQETFLVAFRKLDAFEPRARLYTWLSHICVNLCFARLRKRRRTVVTAGEDLEYLLRNRSAEEGRLQDEREEETRRLALLKGLAGSLEERCRRIIEARHFKGLSYIGIAREMKVPIGTVMSQLARCRDALRGLLEHDGGKGRT